MASAKSWFWQIAPNAQFSVLMAIIQGAWQNIAIILAVYASVGVRIFN
ncbi:hypothetical protein ACFBZI_04820 [Moraxella sp. ZJ142]